MNPGLGVRQLHAQGLTGKGISVAIIDQPLFQDHPEFAGKILAYHDVGCKSENSMHGPSVASLLVGAKCGTAPDARLFFVAAPSWTADSMFQAQALDWIVDQNAKLESEKKIRVVSVSAAPSGPVRPLRRILNCGMQLVHGRMQQGSWSWIVPPIVALSGHASMTSRTLKMLQNASRAFHAGRACPAIIDTF
jgi:hypothetical protein